MDKESAYELQKIDCNCNDCIFMQRDLVKFNTVFAEHFDLQVWFYRRKKARRIWEAREKIRKDKEKGLQALRQAMQLNFHHVDCISSYGRCTKFSNDITFIPNTLQLHTQDCFVHRKDKEI